MSYKQTQEEIEVLRTSLYNHAARQIGCSYWDAKSSSERYNEDMRKINGEKKKPSLKVSKFDLFIFSGMIAAGVILVYDAWVAWGCPM